MHLCATPHPRNNATASQASSRLSAQYGRHGRKQPSLALVATGCDIVEENQAGLVAVRGWVRCLCSAPRPQRLGPCPSILNFFAGRKLPAGLGASGWQDESQCVYQWLGRDAANNNSCHAKQKKLTQFRSGRSLEPHLLGSGAALGSARHLCLVRCAYERTGAPGFDLQQRGALRCA